VIPPAELGELEAFRSLLPGWLEARGFRRGYAWTKFARRADLTNDLGDTSGTRA
jgi:hypothetical protein